MSAVDASRIARYLNNEFEFDENQKHAAGLGHYICKNGNQVEHAYTNKTDCLANSYSWVPNITAQSHANIAKYAAGITDELGVNNGDHWTFIGPDGEVMGKTNDGVVIPYHFDISGSNVEIPSFSGIRLGDVTGNWSAPPPGLNRKSQMMMVNNSMMDISQTGNVSLPIYMPEEMSVEGVDITIEYDPSIFRVKSFNNSNGMLNMDDYSTVINNTQNGIFKFVGYAQNSPEVLTGLIGTIEFEMISMVTVQSTIRLKDLRINDMNVGGFKVEEDGKVTITSEVNVMIEVLPESFALNQNYPNPFNPITSINFELSQDGDVKILVYDIKGALVDEMLNQWMKAGVHKYEWNAFEKASGIYFLHMIADHGNYQKIMRMTLVK